MSTTGTLEPRGTQRLTRRSPSRHPFLETEVCRWCPWVDASEPTDNEASLDRFQSVAGRSRHGSDWGNVTVRVTDLRGRSFERKRFQARSWRRNEASWKCKWLTCLTSLTCLSCLSCLTCLTCLNFLVSRRVPTKTVYFFWILFKI